jgi:hypothetical protein
MTDFYNQYTVCRAGPENKTGPLATFISNQIVVWGQLIPFRVDDVMMDRTQAGRSALPISISRGFRNERQAIEVLGGDKQSIGGPV